MIDTILEYNKHFVESKSYTHFLTTKYPDRKLAILTCMDTRLTVLLPAALGIKNGDAKFIMNAGGVVLEPHGSAMRSVLIAVAELGVNEIMVIGHTDCGTQGLNGDKVLDDLIERGIDAEHIDRMKNEFSEYKEWLAGFEDTDEAVRTTVKVLTEHPLIPNDVNIRGFIIDSVTGELTPL